MTLNAAKELGKIIGNLSKEVSETKDAINPNEEAAQRQFYTSETLIVKQGPTIVKRRDISTDSLWDVAIWDTNNWEGDYDNAQEIAYIHNQADTWWEYFNFTDFEDATSTATWDTTNQKASFTSGEILLTDSIFKDITSTYTITHATPQLTIASGSYTIELSADGGSNWVTFTNGVRKAFTNTGSDLRLRVTENLASTGEITRLKVKYTRT